MEHRDGFKGGDCPQSGPQIVLITLRAGRRHGHVYVEPCAFGFLQHFEALLNSRGTRFVKLSNSVVESRQAHAKEQTMAETFVDFKIINGQRAAGQNPYVDGRVLKDQLQGTPHQQAQLGV